MLFSSPPFFFLQIHPKDIRCVVTTILGKGFMVKVYSVYTYARKDFCILKLVRRNSLTYTHTQKQRHTHTKAVHIFCDLINLYNTD